MNVGGTLRGRGDPWSVVRVIPDGVGILADIRRPPEWMASGLCAQTDPDLFFPESGESASPARQVCRMCEVQQQCRDYAFEQREAFGVWGGLSGMERRRIMGRENEAVA